MAASSTTITRISSGAETIGVPGKAGAMALIATLYSRLTQPNLNATLNAKILKRRLLPIRSSRRDQSDLLELGLDDFFVERLHDVLVGAGVERARDVRDVVFGGAEHHLGPVAAGKPAQRLEELVAVHLRHIPVEKDGVRELA